MTPSHDHVIDAVKDIPMRPPSDGIPVAAVEVDASKNESEVVEA